MPKVLRDFRTLIFAKDKDKRTKPALLLEFEEDKLEKITLVTLRNGSIELSLDELEEIASLSEEAIAALRPEGQRG